MATWLLQTNLQVDKLTVWAQNFEKDQQIGFCSDIRDIQIIGYIPHVLLRHAPFCVTQPQSRHGQKLWPAGVSKNLGDPTRIAIRLKRIKHKIAHTQIHKYNIYIYIKYTQPIFSNSIYIYIYYTNSIYIYIYIIHIVYIYIYIIYIWILYIKLYVKYT